MSRNKSQIVILITIITVNIFLLISCVPKSKLQHALNKQDTLNNRLNFEINQNSLLRFEYVKIKTAFLEHLRNDSLKANNISETQILDNTLFAFPNPPPQPSASYLLDSKYFVKCKTYNDVNNLLIKVLTNSGYDNKINYFLFGEGFAVATEVEQINSDVTVKPSNERWFNEKANSRKNYTFKEYFNALFNAQPGFYRSFVFIVSPVIYRFDSGSYTKELYAKYLSQGAIGLPLNIGKNVLPLNNKVTVLVYEFKKPENSDEAILQTDGYSGYEHLKKANIIKNLANAN